MVSLRTPFYFAEAVFLDLLSLPGKFMNRKENARWHLEHVCLRCSKWRKKFRDPNFEGGRCLWQEEWGAGNYTFPRDFGLSNWLRYYFGYTTDLKRYVNYMSAAGEEID